MTSRTIADVIVVGLGAAGSATAYQLAQLGASVIGIDAHQPPHAYGSTHGDTRLTRLALGEGTAYVPLVLRSHQLWREIEAETGTALLDECGGLYLAPETGEVQAHGATDFFGTVLRAAQTFGIAHDLLNTEQIQAQFPQFRLDAPHRGYYEHRAGYVLPEAAVAAQLGLAARHGATLRYGETVTRIDCATDGVTVHTSSGCYSAGQVVVAAGPWLPELLDAPVLSGLFRVYRQVLHWFDTTQSEAFKPGLCPVYIWHFNRESKNGREAATDDGPSLLYGFPTTGRTLGVKVATEQYRTATTPDTVDRVVDEQESLAMYDAYIAGRMPGVARRPIKSVTCLYTVTPDSAFVIDTLPDDPRVLVASPCSGHGFKHSAAIGEALAQRIVRGDSELDLTPFALSRFAQPT